MGELLNDYLHNLYTSPHRPTAFSGKAKLYTEAQKHPDFSKTKADEWLSGIDAYTLHKPTRRRFKRRRTIVSGPSIQAQADLMDISSLASFNDNFHFLLTFVDVFTKRASVYPIVSKSGKNVADALTKLLSTQSFDMIQTDKGKEFYNTNVAGVLRQHKIKHFSSHDEVTKASVVERFNRTLRDKLYRYMTHNNTRRFIGVLEDIVQGYNKTYHTSLGMSPIEVNEDNQDDVWVRLYELDEDVLEYKPPRYAVDDAVRITKARGAFERGYTPNWSREIFYVKKIRDETHPRVYILADYEGEEIEGSFYEAELQKVKIPEEWRVEEVVRWRGRRGNREALVKWLGYPSSMNSWVKESDIV